MRRRIAILASGTGSNAENLAAYFQNSDVAEVALLIADREAPVIDRLKPYGVPAVIVPRAEWRDNPQKAVAVMRNAAVDLVVLAGFLTVVPAEVLEAFPERIVNVHPSLLPKFGGKGMWGMNVHRAVIAAGEAESGITSTMCRKASTQERRLPSSVVRSPRPTPPTPLLQKSTRSNRRISLKLYKNWWKKEWTDCDDCKKQRKYKIDRNYDRAAKAITTAMLAVIRAKKKMIRQRCQMSSCVCCLLPLR